MWGCSNITLYSNIAYQNHNQDSWNHIVKTLEYHNHTLCVEITFISGFLIICKNVSTDRVENRLNIIHF
jgi:hypothetical protein